MTPKYEEIRQEIINTLEGRASGHEILPSEHQKFALDLLEYTKSIELISASTLVGYADANTVPVQSDQSNASYINTMPNSTTVTFNNFRDRYGNSISVTTTNEYAALNILLWNRQYWEVYTTQIHITAIADLSAILKKIKLDEDLTTNVTCGGIAAGTLIPQGTELKQIILDMLYTYIAPTLEIGGGGNYEVGTTQSPTITYKGSNSSSANVTKLILKKTVGGSESELETRDPATSGTQYSYNDNNVSVNTKYTAYLYDNVKGAQVAVNASANVNFYSRYFWGYAAQGALPSTSATVRALANKGFVTITSGSQTLVTARTVATSFYLVLAVPEGYHMAVDNEFGAAINPIYGGSVQVKIGEGQSSETETYKVYYIEGTPIFKNLKIVKD